MEFYSDIATFDANYFPHSPIRKRFVYRMRNRENTRYLIAYRELHRLFKVQKNTSTTHVFRLGVERMSILVPHDGCPGCKYVAQFFPLV
jgi:hypothetical protein